MNKLVKSIVALIHLLSVAMFLFLMNDQAQAQGQTKWLQIGSLHNWYSEKGGESEDGNVLEQQYGLRWPALVNRTDGQAAKGFWIGATNFTDNSGTTWNPKVIVVGPRWNGDNEFFPKKFELYAQFDPPRVYVNGNLSIANPEVMKAVIDTLKSDRMIYSKVTTVLGLTVERRIYAFSQQFHDNYHIMDYTFTNTGNTDLTPPLTAKTLTGVAFYWQFRYAPGGPGPGFEVNNSARWGTNSMNDARGYPPDTANNLIQESENDVRCMFTWLGLHNAANKPQAVSSPNAATFDNIGSPIFNTSFGGVSTYIQAADTNWRLGAAQIAGNGPIYADKSSTDHTDAGLSQPSTTSFLGSDVPMTSNADMQFDKASMAIQYAKMTEGHAPRQAWLVDSLGKFDQQTVMGNIGSGAPGGWSHGMGFGPYTIAPGQSVRVVWVEGVNGLTFDECVSVGLQYKLGRINTKAKNDSVLNGRLRLFETMRRAVANFNSGFNIPEPPFPPATFNVRGGGDRIALSWDPNPKESANGFVGYRVYRATGRADSTYRMIYQCGGSKPTGPNIRYDTTKTYAFSDLTAIRGISYYYYITSFGNAFAGDAATRTPAAPAGLESSLFYTKTNDPATTVLVGIKNESAIPTMFSLVQNFPNPFNPSTTVSYSLPKRAIVSIRIFNTLGQEVALLVNELKEAGTYQLAWNASNVPSGIYFYRLQGGEYMETKKMILLR
ncbi:MAG: T9SS type A sorting domain-containing protein [Ignavibacteriales bacterium]|nr:T9SS type A sorting domain-containing protein [Ignavibacteriales bacterium]